MSVLLFPSNPVVGQLYDFGQYRYRWDGEKWATIGSGFNQGAILTTQTFEALRRSYAEAGFNLVAGSFESGGTLVNSNDVLLSEASGKAYSGPAGAVAAGTNPLVGGFVDRSGELLRNLLSTALVLRDSRYALRDVVSVEDFDAPDDTQRFTEAINYIVANYGGGSILVPPKTWNASINLPSNCVLIGFGEKSIIRGVTTGNNSYTVKLSNSEVGIYPYGSGKTPVKFANLHNLVIDANGSDFGLYAAYCLFTDWTGVNIYNAKVRNLCMFAVFSFSIDKMLLSYSQSVGGSIGENIFGWAGGDEGIICNGGNYRRLTAFGSGTALGTGSIPVYDKTTNPKAGVGLIIRGGSGHNFNSFQGEQNKGPGLYVMPGTQGSFYGIYLEANANDGTTERRQIVNESPAVTFYDVEPRFNSTDVFYAFSNTYIFGYLGTRITGPGYVSIGGKFNNTTIENPWVQTIKLSEATNVDSAGASTRHNILRPAYRSTENSFKTNVYEMGVYITFRSTQTVLAGKNIIVRPVSLTPTLQTLAVPEGTYSDGDTIYMRFLTYSPDLEALNAVNIGYGAGWTGIGFIDIGMYIKMIV